ncbi:MAG: hypothetical protein HQK50_01530 [Oligoflexia bacterium]|nr:hypothetical protein [Oligoflexia bacterium]MBF0364218.1 hypothetical protein [Oligoflexia bacterium]
MKFLSTIKSSFLKMLLMLSFTSLLPITAFAISNVPLADYSANYSCGPQGSISFSCRSSEQRKEYCQGFKQFLDTISGASHFLNFNESVIWCWTIIEQWHSCQYPHPKLAPLCRGLAENAPLPDGSKCKQEGFRNAKIMYLRDLDNQCGAIM